jgi:hypothetical protein
MSNDRLTRIAEGTRCGDKSATTTAEMVDGQSGTIELPTRVFVRHVDEKTDMASIWIGRDQKTGRKVDKEIYEYHNPVRMDKISSGGYMYCHWHGRPGQTNKWQYGVSDLGSFKMEEIKGVLKHPLMVVKITSPGDRRMYREGAPPMGLSTEDYETWQTPQVEATGNKATKIFCTRYFAS